MFISLEGKKKQQKYKQFNLYRKLTKTKTKTKTKSNFDYN